MSFKEKPGSKKAPKTIEMSAGIEVYRSLYSYVHLGTVAGYVLCLCCRDGN